MSNSQQLYMGAQPIDYVAQFGYPSTVLVATKTGSQGSIHLIWSSAAITPSTTVLAKAPNGSVCFDLSVASPKIWIKGIGSGFGAIDGVWKGSVAS